MGHLKKGIDEIIGFCGNERTPNKTLNSFVRFPGLLNFVLRKVICCCDSLEWSSSLKEEFLALDTTTFDGFGWIGQFDLF